MTTAKAKTPRTYTTGEAAKLTYVSQQTIIRCFDSGELGGFRVPGAKHRRIPRASLLIFAKRNGIPLDLLEPTLEELADLELVAVLPKGGAGEKSAAERVA